MIEIGRLVVKIAGRDAGKKGIIVDILDDKFVLVDGETRRRKVNVLHIEPLNQVVNISKNASHDQVSKAIDELGLNPRETKPKQKTQKPKKKRKTPEQLKAQKEEKKKTRSMFSSKKSEAKPKEKEESLEAKAGIVEDKKEAKHEPKAAKKEKTESKKEKPAAKKMPAKKK